LAGAVVQITGYLASFLILQFEEALGEFLPGKGTFDEQRLKLIPRKTTPQIRRKNPHGTPHFLK
jgi:hypothetical protein